MEFRTGKLIVCSLLVLAMVIALIFTEGLGNGTCNAASNPPEVRVGSELEFPPYAFIDESGQPAGFSVDLIRAVADAMGLSITISAGPWNSVWNELLAGRLDVLPIVAKLPERLPLVDFSLPHTETYDAFFVRKGDPLIQDIEGAMEKEIVAMRSDAAHHALLESNFRGRLILVDTIPEGLSLISSGKHDAFLCSKLIGTMSIKQHGLKGLIAGPPIPDYKRVFSFAVKKGDIELLEKLNQGLLIIKTSGRYDKIYEKWLAAEEPWRKLQKYLLPAIAIAIAVALIVGFWLVMLQLLVRKRTRELAERNEMLRLAQQGLEEKVSERTSELSRANLSLQTEITERKQAEEALRKNEERFRIAEQLAKMGHFEWDVLNNVIVTSSSLERIHGLEPGDFNGRYEDWLPMVHPDDRAGINEIVQSAFAEKRREERFEFRIVRPDGAVRWLSMDATATYHGSGRPLGVMGAMTDITEIKKTQEELRNSRDDLEKRVQERTHELSRAVERLRIENIQRKQLEDSLRESEIQVRFFASQCLTAQETERRRVAGELHDSIAASLAAVRLRIERLAEENKQGPSRTESLQEIAFRVAGINTDVRRIMADLRPSILDDLGILAAMNWFCREFEKTYPQISVEKQIGIEEDEVPDSLKTPIFRICQEAMNNIAKYSQASRVAFSLQGRDGRVELSIQDNGRGFDLETVRRGMGLSTMRERAQLSGGSFGLESTIGKGTTIRAVWPI